MTEGAVAPGGAGPSKNVFSRIAGVLFAPGETFEDIVRRPNIVAPLLLIVIVGFLFAIVAVPRLDLSSMREQQAEAMRKRDAKMTDEQLAQMEKMSGAIVKTTTWVLPVLLIGWYAIMAGVMLLVFRMMGGQGTYGQSFSVTLYSWMPMVVASVLMIIIVLVRDTFDPVEAATLFKSNPAFLVDMKTQPVLFSLLGSIDLFSIWMLILMIFGFSAMSKLPKGKSAAIVISLWIAYVVVKVGFSAAGAAMNS